MLLTKGTFLIKEANTKLNATANGATMSSLTIGSTAHDCTSRDKIIKTRGWKI